MAVPYDVVKSLTMENILGSIRVEEGTEDINTYILNPF